MVVDRPYTSLPVNTIAAKIQRTRLITPSTEHSSHNSEDNFITPMEIVYVVPFTFRKSVSLSVCINRLNLSMILE